MGLGYNFTGSVHYHHVREHGSNQIDVVSEKKLRVLHLGLKAGRRLIPAGTQKEGLFWVELEHRNLKVIYFL